MPVTEAAVHEQLKQVIDPELFVNILGAIRGETGLAFGNVVGSNISNLSLVLGAAALFRAITIQSDLVLREVPLLLLATTATTAMALDGVLDGSAPLLSRTDSLVLLLLFGVFVYITLLDLLRAPKRDPLLQDIEESLEITVPEPGRFGWALALAGIVTLFVGGEMTISSGTALADLFGVSPTIVGLFVVAVGTSMPELVTSVIAAMRGESDLALGNVVGSNIFNTLLVLPVSGLFTPIAIPAGGLADLALSWALAAALIPLFLFGKAQLSRRAGAVAVLLYFAYAGLRIGYGVT